MRENGYRRLVITGTSVEEPDDHDAYESYLAASTREHRAWAVLIIFAWVIAFWTAALSIVGAAVWLFCRFVHAH